MLSAAPTMRSAIWGSDTASSGWIYNQIGLNPTGILVVVFALGLWRELSPDLLGRLGAVALALTGFTLFLQGFFRLDCQAIDAGCENTSWHSEAHSSATGVSTAFLFAAPLLLALAFRRLPRWRDTWLPTLAAVPVFSAVSIVFSAFGAGASTRAGAVAWFIWLAFIALRLLQRSETVRAAG
jgi:Protein of unknown function (DUF998)